MIKQFTTRAAGLAAATALLGAAGTAQAVLVTSNAGFAAAQVVTFDSFDGLLTAGALDVGTPSIGSALWLTATADAEVGANVRDLGENGLWGARGNPVDGLVPTPTGSGSFVATAFAAPRGEIAFTLATPVAGIGAFMNQFQTASGRNAFAVLAYDAEGNVLEAHAFRVDTAFDSYNEGSFVGIHRLSADIYSFSVAGNNFVMDDLTLTTAPVPEPGVWALMLAGLAGVGIAARRRRAGSAG